MYSIEMEPMTSPQATAGERLALGTIRELSDAELLFVSGAWGRYAIGFPAPAGAPMGGMVPGGSPIHAYASYTDPLYSPRPPTDPWYGADLNAWKNAP